MSFSRLNDLLTAREDSIRMAYVVTFATPESASALAKSLGTDEGKTKEVLIQSRGNHSGISKFLTGIPADQRDKALRLLLAVSEKDRRDISAEVLTDHLATPETESPLFDRYIMNPRIDGVAKVTT